MDGQGTTGDKARIRRSLLVSAAMLLIAFSVFGGLFYLQRQAASQNNGAHSYGEEDPTEVAKMRQVRLERAKFLREKWRSWAEKHKDLLKRMLAAKPDDQAALMDVWDAIPKHPEDGSDITATLLSPSRSVRKDMESGLLFSWAGIDKNLFERNPQIEAHFKARAKDPQSGGDLGAHQRRFIGSLQKNFADLRDIVISDSVGGGRQKIRLWASGRITEATWEKASDFVAKDDKRSKRTWDVEGPHKELVPSYDFLRASK